MIIKRLLQGVVLSTWGVASLSGAQQSTGDRPTGSEFFYPQGAFGQGSGGQSGSSGQTSSGGGFTPSMTMGNGVRVISNTSALRVDEGGAGSKDASALDRDWVPLSNFQKLVFETTGRLLPIFGESLAKTKDNTLSAPVSADYEVGVGDELLVRAWGGVEIHYQVTVDRDGQITIPTVGTFPVAGVRARDLDSVISAQVKKYYKGFNLSTTFGKLSGISVFVSGQAASPGVKQVSSSSTLSTVALSLAKPGPNGSYRNIQLKRAGKVVASFDLYDLLQNGNLKEDHRLQAGDVILVGPVGTRVALNVDSPSAAIFELKQGESLDQLMSLAGVDRTLIRQDFVLIEGVRSDKPSAPRTVEKVAYDSAIQQAKLKDGDVVTLFSASPGFGNAVTLKGNVADPARYPFVPGMKVSDLIPSTEVLLPRDYFKKKNALVGVDQEKAKRFQQRDPRLLADRFDEQDDAQQMSPSQPRTQQQGASYAYQQQMQGQDRSALKGERSYYQQDNNQGFGGSRKAETKIDTLEQTVRSMLNQINWDYAVIERLDSKELRSVLIPFNLRKAIAKDPQHDLELQSGDVLTVFSVTDTQIPKERKTALIKVTGEVGSPGFYQIGHGETLRDVLVKAGGTTRNAYLYGASLTRESIRADQEKKYQRALDQAEQLLFSSQTSRAASAVTATDAASVQAQQESQRQYLAKLRAVKPEGRVVLDVRPAASSVAELPPIALEDGDVVNIPSVPGEVTIFGSVYSQGVYAYQSGHTVFDYLKMAGGATKTSDKGSIFVLRANGMVESAQQGWLPFVGGLNRASAQPGDTIYVPEDFDRVSLIKTLADISQVFYQVGLGAAAIKVLKD